MIEHTSSDQAVDIPPAQEESLTALSPDESAWLALVQRGREANRACEVILGKLSAKNAPKTFFIKALRSFAFHMRTPEKIQALRDDPRFALIARRVENMHQELSTNEFSKVAFSFTRLGLYPNWIYERLQEITLPELLTINQKRGLELACAAIYCDLEHSVCGKFLLYKLPYYLSKRQDSRHMLRDVRRMTGKTIDDVDAALAYDRPRLRDDELRFSQCAFDAMTATFCGIPGANPRCYLDQIHAPGYMCVAKVVEACELHDYREQDTLDWISAQMTALYQSDRCSPECFLHLASRTSRLGSLKSFRWESIIELHDKVSRLDPAALSDAVTACARSNVHCDAFLEALAPQLAERGGDFTPALLTHLAWGIATLNFSNKEISKALLRHGTNKLEYFGPDHGALFAWSLAILDPNSSRDFLVKYALYYRDPNMLSPKGQTQLHIAQVVSGLRAANNYHPTMAKILENLTLRTIPSKLEQEADDALTELAEAARTPLEIHRQQLVGGVITNFAIVFDGGARRVALDCNNDTDYRVGGSGVKRPIGPKVLHDRVLRAAGWEPKHLLSSDWHAAQDRPGLLRELLDLREDPCPAPA